MTSGARGNGTGPRDGVPQGSHSPPDPAPAPAAGPTAPKNPLRRTVRVVNPLGIHQRVADRFARAAKRYPCTVTVWNGDTRADGKNLWDLILLVAFPGAELVLEVDGPEAAVALDPLAAILAAPGGEDYTI